MESRSRLPKWLKMERASGANYSHVKHIVEENALHTICTSGNCPNIGECWNSGTATFMILGDICTRACRFCATITGRPLPPDCNEPERLAESVKKLGLKHCVITSVDRDDIPDGGASHWAQVIEAIKLVNPGITVETLIPDFDGVVENIMKVVNAKPEVISHNIETVRRLTPLVRTKAKYDTSLNVLRVISGAGVTTKSGLMLGLGEAREEVLEAMDDLLGAGCTIITIGQYLKPTREHMEVVEFVTPEKFNDYRREALQKGFRFVESSPLVRSSFHAEKHVNHR